MKAQMETYHRTNQVPCTVIGTTWQQTRCANPINRVKRFVGRRYKRTRGLTLRKNTACTMSIHIGSNHSTNAAYGTSESDDEGIATEVTISEDTDTSSSSIFCESPMAIEARRAMREQSPTSSEIDRIHETINNMREDPFWINPSGLIRRPPVYAEAETQTGTVPGRNIGECSGVAFND